MLTETKFHLLGGSGLLGQQTQLLLPLLSHFGDDGVEEAELLTLLVHLIVGILKHHLEPVVSQDAGQGLQIFNGWLRVEREKG